MPCEYAIAWATENAQLGWLFIIALERVPAASVGECLAFQHFAD